MWWAGAAPFLLLPAGITERLTPLQLEAVLAHELCHVRRRDNLSAAIHMMVEGAFWFHPLVWWIGARLVEERERACDEEVLQLGGEPHIYAEALLSVCKHYLESPLVCVSGISGSDLKKRIPAILSGRVARELTRTRKAALVAAGMAALVAPIVVGMMHAPGAIAAPRPPIASVPAEVPPPVPRDSGAASRGPQSAGHNAGPNARRGACPPRGLRQ